jgi:hypothetical protein
MKSMVFMFTTGLLLLSIAGLVVILNSKADNHYAGHTIEKITSPETALETYIHGAITGNEKLVNAIAIRANDDWLNECINKSQTENEEIVNNLELSSNQEMLKTQTEEKRNSEEQKVSFNGDNVSENIRIFSRYIFVGKIAKERFKIVDKQMFDSEALLRVEISDNRGNFSNSEKFAFAFTKINNEWKIIGIVQTGVFEFVDNKIQYGSPRPLCK